MNKFFNRVYKKAFAKKIIFIFLFILLGLLFLFPRSIDILNGNPLFTFDQGREYLVVRDIVVNHKFTLIGAELGAGSAGINGLFHGPLFYYSLIIPFVIFDGDPNGGTVLMFIYNLLCVVLLFHFIKKILGLWPAIVASFLFAISPIFISQARFIWNPNPPGLFVLLSFYFTYFFYQKRYLNIFLAAFFAAFVYNFEMGIAVPMCVALTLYSIYYFRNKLKNYFFLFLGFTLGFLPMLLFELRHDFMGLRGLVSYLTFKKAESGGIQTNYLLDHFNSIIYNLNNTFGIEQWASGIWFFVPTLVLLSAVVFYFKKEKSREIKNLIIYFGILIIATFLVFANLRNALYGYYLTDLSLIYIFFFSYVLFAAYKRKNFKVVYALIIFLVALVFYAIPQQTKTSIHDLKDYGGTAKLAGKIDALDFIYKDADGKPFGLLVFSPPVYTYPYDYIIQWYGQQKYGYIPHQDKKGTLYLLIEKDYEKPWSYKGWLETVIKVGRVEYTKTLKSGFIVQKREVGEIEK